MATWEDIFNSESEEEEFWVLPKLICPEETYQKKTLDRAIFLLTKIAVKAALKRKKARTKVMTRNNGPAMLKILLSKISTNPPVPQLNYRLQKLQEISLS